MKKIYFLALSCMMSYGVVFAQSDTTYTYTGSVQTYTVPPCVYQITVDVRGGQGMANTDHTSLGGKGGRIQGSLSVTPGQVLDINIGGGGYTSDTGGFNGGGNGGTSIAIAYWAFYPACASANGGGGGGASDIRSSPYGLSDRMVVGGGGGGTGGDRMPGCGPGAGGGGGGGYYGGGGGGGYSGLPGYGGSQSAGGDSGTSPGCAIYGGQAGTSGTFGYGGTGGHAPGNNQGTPLNDGCTGGGGGTSVGATGVNCTGGGCPGTWSGGSGGGGSNYAEPCMASVIQTQGYQTGDGEVTIHPICGGSPLTDSIVQHNPTCGNGCNGSIEAIVSGGSSPYTYSWSPGGQTGDTATGLCGGTYTLIITDATGCATLIDSVTLPSNSLNVAASSIVEEPCHGNCIGSIAAAVSGGVAPYTYVWSIGGTTNNVSNLCTGTYTLEVTDTKGCTGTLSVTITAPTAVTGTSNVTNVVCYGGVGTATVTPAGGTSPYSYSWSPTNQSTAVATGLSAGSYNVTITDVNGCTGSLVVSLTQPTPVVVSIGSVTYPSCNGGTGTATGTGGGGVSPYSYRWSPIGGTNALGTGLTAGTYTVTATDANGCTVTASILITQPPSLSGRITIISYPPCNAGIGSAQVAGSGGTPNYSYVWHPTGQTNATATGLAAGTYTVNITDAHGCTGTVTTTISQPNTLTVSATFTHASCGLGNGTATASPNGGTGPYAYVWAPTGQTNATATGLHAGGYTVTVTDKNHCTASTTVTVTQPSAVTAEITGTTNVNCFGQANGNAVSVAGGGTPAYTYAWSPSGGSGATGNNLVAGNYTVKITDANGCTATASTTITQPTLLTASVNGPVIRCLGKNGVYTVSASGGTGPYAYSWSPVIGVSNPTSPNPTITPAGTQTYTIQVTDAHGCTVNAYQSFSFPPPLGVSIQGASVTCSGRTAAMCALATGGTGGDIYQWEPVNLGSPCITVPVSQETTYTVTVTDNCNVSVSATTVIHVNPPPAVVFTASTQFGCTPLCVQFRNLTQATGGKEQYIWEFGNGDSALTENPLYCYPSNGTYNVTLTVISDSGCSSTLTKVDLITAYGRPQAAFTYSPQPVSILTPTVEFIDKSTDINGIAYRFWTFGDNSDSASNLANPTHTYGDTGTYCATLVAVNSRGCMDTATNCLVIEPQYSLYIPSAFTPNADGLNETFQPVGQYIKSFEMYIFDRWGLQLYHTKDITKGWNGTVNGSGGIAQEDTYVYKITVTDAEDLPHSYIGNVTLLK